MVERSIAARGVQDELVLEAMRKVPRELFLPKKLQQFAYRAIADCCRAGRLASAGKP